MLNKIFIKNNFVKTKILVTVLVASSLFTSSVYAHQSKKLINNIDFSKTQSTQKNSKKIGARFDQKIQAHTSDEIIVKYKKNKIDLEGFSGVSDENNFSRNKSLEKKSNFNKENSTVFKIKDSKTVEQKISELQNDPNVESVQPNYVYTPMDTANDPGFINQWSLNNTGQTITDANGISTTGASGTDIKMLNAWGINEGTNIMGGAGSNIAPIVAVIDMGVDYELPDLVNQMWDGSLCKDDLGNPLGGCNHGYDFEDNDKTPLPTYSQHGTNVAGVIAAEKDNTIGIAGIAPHAKIMALKTGLTTDQIVRAINFAGQNGANIINASFGGPSFDPQIHDAIVNFNGLFITSSGNCGDASNYTFNGCSTQNQTLYPAGYNLPNEISVAATTQDDSLASFSNSGTSTALVGAPGVNILTTSFSFATSTLFNEDFESVATSEIGSNFTQTGSSTFGVFYYSGISNILLTDYPSYISTSTNFYSSNTNSTVTSPVVDLSNNKNSNLTFDVFCDIGTSTTDKLSLQFFDGTTWKTKDTFIDTVPFIISYGYSLSDYASNNFQFAFNWTTGSSTNDGHVGCLIDNVNITSVGFTNPSYSYHTGTSLAAPEVSGLAALVWGFRPTLSATTVRQAILNDGDSITSLSNNKTLTGKRINAYNTINQFLSDMTALNSAISNAQNLIASSTEGTLTGEYPSGSKDALQLVINSALGVKNTAEQSVVDSAMLALNNAINVFDSLKIVALDFTSLNTSITDAQNLIASSTIGELPGNYSTSSVEVLQSAIDTASSTLSTATLQNQIDSAVTTLNSAITTFRSSVVVDTALPIITVTGSSTLTITQGTEYHDAGATSTDSNGVTLVVTATGTEIDTGIIGTYTITYSVTDSMGHTVTATRTVNVIEEIISSDLTVLNSKILEAQTLIASSTEGTTVGKYAIGSQLVFQTAINTALTFTSTSTQSAIDAEVVTLNTAIATFKSGRVPDTTAPVITLNGSASVIIAQGSGYSDAGATAIDDLDGIVSVSSSGNVDYNTIGTYTITYTAKDAAGNTSTATRTVSVRAATFNSNSGGGGGGGGSNNFVSVSPLSQLVTKVGDANHDGKVDKYDFAVLMAQWGKTGTGLSADLNNDGKVDKYDFSLLMSHWNN